jgi:hypothetical protein
MQPPNKAFVAPAPPIFHEKCPGESWQIWVHKNPKDFEMNSCGATAGFFSEGTELQVIKRWEVSLTIDGLKNQQTPLLKVRGNDENGKRITGWVMAHCVEIGTAARKQRILLSKKEK